MKEIDSIQLTVLTTDRLVLRPLISSDASAISTIRSTEGVSKYIDRAKQLSIDEAHAAIAKIIDNVKNGTCFYWAVCLKSNVELIGTVCLFNFQTTNKTAELGYELAPGHQGQGIANEMISPVIEFAFNTAGHKMIEACVHRENTKSKNLLLRNNFKSDLTRKDEKNADNIFFTLAKY